MSEFLRRWGPAMLWTAVLFAVGTRSSLPVDLHSGTDKLAHFGAYAVLGVLLAYGQHRAGVSFVGAVLIGGAVGAADELLQSTVPGRHGDPADWLADALGVAAGVLFFHLWRRARERRGPRSRRPEPIPHE